MDTSLEFTDYVSYWLQLFPEINKPDELDSILQCVSQTSLKDLQLEISEGVKGGQYNGSRDLVEQILNCSRMPLMVSISDRVKSKLPYYYFMEPIINLALSRYYTKITDSAILAGTEAFWENTITQLALILFRLTERTMILEINVAREEGLLVGPTAKERFEYFTTVLLRDSIYLRRLYEEYQVLVELLHEKASSYLDFIREVLDNTQAELTAIAEEVNPGVLAKVVGITLGMGDTHRGGKTVSILTFEKGCKIVYKPRHTELEESFQKLLQWQADNSLLLGNRFVKIHCGNGCGWIEYLKYKECKNPAEVERFYIRVGQLLCLLYSLNAKDFHHENILAMGEFPVLLDLESLFHSNQGMTWDKDNNALVRANGILGRSVYSTGLLPQKITNPSDLYSDRSIDVSGLGGGVAQTSPFQALHVVDDNTDSIRLVSKHGSILPKDNSPKIEGEIQDSTEYTESIKKGFTAMYLFLLEKKDEYIEVMERLFSGSQNRFILRPTFRYAQLLATSYHPDFLRDSIHRRVLLHRIGIGGAGDGSQILTCEFEDLMNGEVPLFNIGIDSLTLLDSRGRGIPGVIERTPMEEVREKVEHLSREDLEFQLSIIDTAFAAKDSNSKRDTTNISFDFALQVSKLKPQKWLALAIELGDYIIQKGIYGQTNGETDVTWLSTILEGRDELTWSLAPVGTDLYNGNSGIALFLGYLGALSGKPRFTQAAFQAINPLLRKIGTLVPEHPYTIGAFNGISGYFYVLAKLAGLTGNKKLEDFVKSNLRIWRNLIEGDRIFDVIGGSAGSLAVLYSLEEQPFLAGKNLKDMMDACYRHIAANPREFSLGISWGLSPEHVPYSGFAHGNAGIAAYLARYYARTGNSSVNDLISRTLELERGLYTEEHKNWFPSMVKDRISSGWCHGAPGILLSKVILLKAGYEDEYLEEEIDISLGTTLASLGFNTSLCHGDLGNLAILKYAAKALGRWDLENAATGTFQKLFDSVLKERWQDGLFRGTESLGLMVGLAGVGFAILKQFAPEFVPEILVLD